MYRCLAASLLCAAFVSPSLAQVQRPFPANALRGVITVTSPPDITLNKEPARLSPGARIRDTRNMQVMSASIVDQKLLTHYTVDANGQVSAVWILTDDEAKKLWPWTVKEASSWAFDPVAQTWTKP
jgi:hypothetical protein